MNQIVNYSEIELLTVTRKYTRCVELYTLVCGVLPNIKNVIWRIYLNSKESYESYSKDQHILWEQLRIRMLELAKNTGNIILFEELENMSVANVKGNYFATVGANGNRWVMSVDDDMLFPVLTLANLSMC